MRGTSAVGAHRPERREGRVGEAVAHQVGALPADRRVAWARGVVEPRRRSTTGQAWRARMSNPTAFGLQVFGDRTMSDRLAARGPAP